MADIKNMVLGTVLFVGLISGLYSVFNNWYASTPGVTATLDSSTFNVSGVNNYMGNWANQTASLMSNAAAVPILGSGFVLLTGVFQSITLVVGMPNAVILPLFNAIAGVIPLPTWFTALLFLTILISVLIYIINAMKGSTPV